MSKKSRDLADNASPTEEVGADPVLSDVPVPVAAAVDVPVIVPDVAVAPADAESLIPLRVYATIAGPKWDQMAGFVSHATRNRLGPCTMAQWIDEFEKFKQRRVG